MIVLVTGGTGFVGRALLARCSGESDMLLRASIRRDSQYVSRGVKPIVVGDLEQGTDWSAALAGAQMVVHTAARVHVMRDDAVDPLREFRRVNVDGTLNLARQAAQAGTQRFVFISSIKVNGDQTSAAHPFSADDIPRPGDPYGISKNEAEQGLRALAAETGMEVVIIRPVLIYGPGVRANFLFMLRCVQRGIPLPLGGIRNRRSLIGIANLTDLIVTCLRHPAAANQTFLASDGEDVSTPELLRRVARSLGTHARLFSIPTLALRASLHLVGKGHIAQRLCSSLQVDITKTRADLGWTPPLSLDSGLRQTAQWLLQGVGCLRGNHQLHRK